MKVLLSIIAIAAVQSAALPASFADDVCDSDEFQKQCEQARLYYQKNCSNPRSLDPYQPESDANDAWVAEVEQIDEIVALWTEVAKKYPSCYSGRGDCRLSEYERDKCLAMPETYKKDYEESIGIIKGNVLDGWKRDIARAHKNPLDPFAKQVFRMARESLTRMRKIAALEFLGADVGEIDELLAWLGGEEKKWRGEREGSLSKVKCPGPKNRDKTLTKKLYAVMIAHGEATKKPGSTLKETVGEFGLSGKPVKKREALRKLTHEDVPGFACVLQERDGDRTCRIFDVTFRRTKPDGGKWGDWAFYSTGGGGEMSCKNLKGIK